MLLYFFVFTFGLIVGSFLNVVIYRYNTGLTIGGRSKCMSCWKTLRWYELVPIFSFAVQRGRCRVCRAAIAWQYPLVEISTGLIFLLITNYELRITNAISVYTLYAICYMLIISSILIVITVYDLRHKIIPNGFVYAFIVLSFFSLIYNFGRFGFEWQRFFAGLAYFAIFGTLWLVSRGRWMGLGDAKLMLGIGWLLPVPQSITAIILSFWIGAVVGILLLMGRRKKYTLKSEMPFAPFLVFGFFLVFFLGLSIV
jgi:prepilin signal peptidase PulO-like enzyme (type II secretory pathway)